MACCPELADAVVLGFLVAQVRARLRRVGDVVMAVVGKCHITRAEIVIALQQGEIPADHVTVLDADRRHQLALGVDTLDIVGRVGQFDQVRVHLPGHPVDGVELRHGIGLRPGVVLRSALGLADVDDEESRVESAGGASSRDSIGVGHPAGPRLRLRSRKGCHRGCRRSSPPRGWRTRGWSALPGCPPAGGSRRIRPVPPPRRRLQRVVPFAVSRFGLRFGKGNATIISSGGRGSRQLRSGCGACVHTLNDKV